MVIGFELIIFAATASAIPAVPQDAIATTPTELEALFLSLDSPRLAVSTRHCICEVRMTHTVGRKFAIF
jgi:hypothetical protein